MSTVIVNVEYLFKSVFRWERFPNKNITAYFSLTKTNEKKKIELKCNVWETAKNYKKYITFKLKDNDYSNESTIKTKNAFKLMRIASTLNYLPEFNLPKNSFDQLHIDLCELIKINSGEWIGKDNANAHPENHRHTQRSFNSNKLQNFYKILINYLELSWISKPKFSWLKVPLQIYVNNLLKYSDYLIEQKVITLKN
ncbi:kinase-like domain-containing protein [Rhizophagus clarus]|uniref:Kinase-like domain-containing protein n=1 Tax=Rhizophagus clarus TaxID=94130 RepID=A0A8H3QGK8_9GLOM|nr:kinase-like domain-containing protein [Rhizophagus clarus]